MELALAAKLGPPQTFCFGVSAIKTSVTVVEDTTFKGHHFTRSVVVLYASGT
jgi:hypothetical protein